MGNTFRWPIVLLVQRLSILLTLACCAYVAYFLLVKKQDNAMPEINSVIPAKGISLIAPSPAFDLKPFDAAINAKDRDIFSMTMPASPTGAVEDTPKGQLPPHFKIVGIIISHPSQIVIEDSFAKKTFFIDENNPQDGIKIKQVQGNQMIINYQGQDIPVPVNKD